MVSARPTVVPLTLPPQDLIVYAARLCYDSFGRASPENDARLLAHLRQNGHLTTYEHAAWVISYFNEYDHEDYQALLALDRPPLTRYHLDRCYFSINLAQIRQLVAGGSWLGKALAEVVRPEVPQALADIPVDRQVAESATDWEQADMRIEQEADLPEPLRRELPVRTFLLTCSRAAAYQVIRYRRTSLGELEHADLSFEQESQRYVPARPELPILPPALAGSSVAQSAFEVSQQVYAALRDAGARRQDARYLLTNAQPTRLLATGSLRQWRHVLRQRGAADAMPETRYLALLIHRELAAENPDLWADVEIVTKGLEPWLTAESSGTASPAA